MTWRMETKCYTIFMYDTYACDMYNYDIEYNVEFCIW